VPLPRDRQYRADDRRHGPEYEAHAGGEPVTFPELLLFDPSIALLGRRGACERSESFLDSTTHQAVRDQEKEKQYLQSKERRRQRRAWATGRKRSPAQRQSANGSDELTPKRPGLDHGPPPP
jgi:hypothetical protein